MSDFTKNMNICNDLNDLGELCNKFFDDYSYLGIKFDSYSENSNNVNFHYTS